MLATLFQRLWLLKRRLWVRVALIACLSLLAVTGAAFLGPLLPAGLAGWIGAGSVDRLLDILASSMLAVTTFSVSVMVTVHRAVSSQWTPRAHRVQLQDQTTQTVLATFVGAFIYALASIILRATEFFADGDLVVLFITTVGVIVLVVVTILRWVFRLQNMGSLADTADLICAQTREALDQAMQRPSLGAQVLTRDVILPPGALDITAQASGYVVRVFASGIDAAAQAQKGAVYLTVAPGDWVDRGRVIAHVTHDALAGSVAQHVQIGPERDIQQDPCFGLLLLAEIGSKALSPGVNDGGTAISMINRIHEILQAQDSAQASPDTNAALSHVWLPPLDPAEMIALPLGLIARDGATSFEVQQVLLSRLHVLSDHPDGQIAAAARQLFKDSLSRSLEQMASDIDRDALRRFVGELAT